MKKFKKKVFKGMTLYEVIIAIAIMAVMTTILVAAGMAINGYLRAANDVNDRVALQAPFAEAKVNPGTEFGTVSIEISITSGASILEVGLSGDMHGVFDDVQMAERSSEAGRGLNMKYIDGLVIPTGTKATAPAGTVTPEEIS